MRALTLLLWAGFGLSSAARAQVFSAEPPRPRPLWEAGVFTGVARLPHYRGSDEYSVYALPLPFFIYRGRFIQSDREGVRGIFYRSELVETTISLFGNPPASKTDDARRGMPALQAIGEAGPAVKLFFRRAPNVFLLAAARGAMAFDPSAWSARWVGIRGGPSLVISDFEPVRGGRWNMGLTAGLDFTNAQYDAYFYDVQASQVTGTRPEFHSRSGYAGSSLSGYAEYRLTPRLTLASYARWDNVDGASYQRSPLVRAANNYIAGGAVIWTLLQSKRQVPGAR